nr:ribonuclease H-like YkuK family protein [Thermosyntropha lipolytica]
MKFKSPSRGEMTMDEVVDDIINYINEDTRRSYKIIVGSDSKVWGKETCFVSAVIVHRVGKGARYYYYKEMEPRIRSMRQRIFYEASLSLSLADELSRLLKEKGRDNLPVEIHLDVGNEGETRELVKEITGMIIGSGFAACIKPDACAASKVADKYTK